MLVSPTEPREIQLLGRVSSLPEKYGVDVLLSARGRLVGVQRKTFPEDYLASLEDGRLQKELMLMQRLDAAVLLLEGQPTWDGQNLVGRRYTRQQLRTALWSIQLAHGVYVERSDSLEDTCMALAWLETWLRKRRHVGLMRRPKARDAWGGRVRGQGQALHILQGLPGVGPVLAQAILKHFGGIPLTWTCSQQELEQVTGIGPKTARRLYVIFERGGKQNDI
jgi:ERCC4-type nuclease